MPAPRTSPPLVRPGRSPSKRRSMQTFTPPVPMWDTAMGMATPPVPLSEKRERRLHTPTPTLISMNGTPRSPRLPLRPSHDIPIASPRMRESPRPALMSPPIIPPVVSPAIRRQKLLPAIPIELHSQSPKTRSRRSTGHGAMEEGREVQIVLNGRESPAIPLPLPSPSLRHRQSSSSLAQQQILATPTPPRPARRRRDSAISPKHIDLLPPRPDFSRAASPSGDSVSTMSDASTPRAASRSIPETADLKGPSKRDSTQRRLDALRGLVANIDFNQPWSLTDDVGSRQNVTFPDPQETLSSPMPIAVSPHFSPLLTSHPVERYALQDHGWNQATPSPARHESRGGSEMRTPTRARREIFNVASSGYSKSLEPTSPVAPPTPEGTWRASLSSDAVYQRVLQRQGIDEVKRQEVIWEMCETEQAFLKSIRNVLRLFAIPLKTPHGKWIDGIPDRISQLFDSLESVAHVHGVIAATQRDMRRKSEVIDLNVFVRAYKAWVPKLEVYEWYLLRFESVVALVEEHIRDPESVFGEFVRMQSKEEALGSMSLGSMLLKPVQRLMKYPLFLKRLLDATPRHPDLLSLLASTESIILRLQAAKAKEEDFDQLLQLESRLSGLPSDFTLAQRGRKLTGHGSVTRVHPNSFPSMMPSSRSSVSSTISSISSPWDAHSIYSPSMSRISSFSVSSTTSSAPSRNGSLRMSPSAFSPSPKRPGMHRSPSSASSASVAGGGGGGTDPSRPGTPSRRRSKDELSLFVFDDLVILAQPSDKTGLFSKSKKDKGWRVLSEAEGGLGKLVEVKDWSGFAGHAALFVLTIMPIATHLRETLLPVTICLTISSTTSPRRGSPALKCTQLSTLPHFLNALAQATTAGPSEHSVYCDEVEGEREEVLFQREGPGGAGGGMDRVEIAFDDGEEHPLHSLMALGYAQ